MSAAAPESHTPTGRLWAALLASTLLNLPLGSVYAFSVLLRPLEQELGITRSALSLVFGVATAGFTVGSVSAPWLYRLAPAPVLVFACAVAASAGVAVAALAHGLPQLLLGYSIVFGTGGGVAYILLQQGVNMLVRGRRGLINGYIVSLYPMGAMIATPAFHACNEAFGWRVTLGGLAAVLLINGAVAALLTVSQSFVIARRFRNRLRSRRNQAEVIALGDYREHPLENPDDELRDLGVAINQLAVILKRKIGGRRPPGRWVEQVVTAL